MTDAYDVYDVTEMDKEIRLVSIRRAKRVLKYRKQQTAPYRYVGAGASPTKQQRRQWRMGA